MEQAAESPSHTLPGTRPNRRRKRSACPCSVRLCFPPPPTTMGKGGNSKSSATTAAAASSRALDPGEVWREDEGKSFKVQKSYVSKSALASIAKRTDPPAKITVVEAAKHNKRDDPWVIVDGKCYDVMMSYSNRGDDVEGETLAQQMPSIWGGGRATRY